MQDYVIGWTQGLWDHINKFDATTARERIERERAKAASYVDRSHQALPRSWPAEIAVASLFCRWPGPAFKSLH